MVFEKIITTKGGCMNWFVFTAGLLYIASAVKYYLDDAPKMCVVFIAYAIANFVLATVSE